MFYGCKVGDNEDKSPTSMFFCSEHTHGLSLHVFPSIVLFKDTILQMLLYKSFGSQHAKHGNCPWDTLPACSVTGDFTLVGISLS